MSEQTLRTALPRIEPGDRKQAGLLAWSLAQAAGLRGRTEPLHIFLTLGKHRKLFRGWLRFAGRLMPGGTLPRRETELVILRVAHLRGNDYEYAHHLKLGRQAGVTDGDLERLTIGAGAPGWAPRDLAILTAVDALHEHQDLDDATWTELREHLDERECIELLMLAAHYEMLATVLTTLRVQPERPRRSRRG
jgi:alkylhydroperoxidase family enzyme